MVGYGAFMFVLFVTYFGMTVKIAPLFEQLGYGTGAQAGLISGISDGIVLLLVDFWKD